MFELQVNKDNEIGDRLLDYNYEARRAYRLPVLSCVISLKRVAEPPLPPLIWHVPGWGRSLAFQYQNLELAETPAEELEQKHLVGISPLLLLCKGGAKREVLDQVVTGLEAAKRAESLMAAKLIALSLQEER